MCIFHVGIEGEDSLTWCFNYYQSERKKEPILMAWIHSHVRSVACNFSSVDLHTQLSYSKIYDDILGLVVEIKENGQLGQHDFFEMSRQGKRLVEKCSKKKDCDSRKQHQSCNNPGFYQSAKNKVLFSEELPLYVRNFIESYEESDIDQNGKQVPMHQMYQSSDEEAYETDDEDFYFTNQKKQKLQNKPKKSAPNDKTQCKVCGTEFARIIMHLQRNTDCRVKYGKEFDKMRKKADLKRRMDSKKNTKKIKEQNAEYYQKNAKKIRENQQKNAKKIKEKKAEYRQKNAEKIQRGNKEWYEKNTEAKKAKEAEKRQKAKDMTTEEQRCLKFKRDIIEGIDFICFSCNRACFKKGVKVIRSKDIEKLFIKVDNHFLKNEIGINDEIVELIFCHNCHNSIKSGKLPRIHKSNGLDLQEVPEELQLTDLEQQLIARALIFLKIKRLPTSRQKANFDRVISVPIDCETVSKTITQLPRHPDDSNIVAVQLKRKLEMKNSHLEEYIRPKTLVKALETLKRVNPFYQDISINEDFFTREVNLDDEDELESQNTGTQNKECDKITTESSQQKNNDSQQKGVYLVLTFLFLKSVPIRFHIFSFPCITFILTFLKLFFFVFFVEVSKEQIEKEQEDENEDEDEEYEDKDEEGENILPNVQAQQSKQDNHTCMMPNDFGDQMFVNNEKSPMYKGDGKNSIKIAPGEGKVPSNILREDHFDVKAFPKHHPDGKFGLHHKPRKYKLSPQVYFNQRLLNADERFSKDPCYLFMASYYVERLSLERQIDISGLRRKQNDTEGEDKALKLNDMFDVLKKVKGSPKFWQTARNELVAKIKQLGPFHVFYTFSCGEMRWCECFLNILKRSGRTIKIPENWDEM